MMISDELEQKIEDLKNEMKEPTSKEKKMEAQTETATKRKPVAKKTVAKKTAAPAKKKVAAKSDDKQVTLKDLAKEVKLEPRVARRILRKAGLETGGRWSWEEGSSALKKAREALTKAE